jgi:hypothetical protein
MPLKLKVLEALTNIIQKKWSHVFSQKSRCDLVIKKFIFL